jgi:hypothetical protein
VNFESPGKNCKKFRKWQVWMILQKYTTS